MAPAIEPSSLATAVSPPPPPDAITPQSKASSPPSSGSPVRRDPSVAQLREALSKAADKHAVAALRGLRMWNKAKPSSASDAGSVDEEHHHQSSPPTPENFGALVSRAQHLLQRVGVIERSDATSEDGDSDSDWSFFNDHAAETASTPPKPAPAAQKSPIRDPPLSDTALASAMISVSLSAPTALAAAVDKTCGSGAAAVWQWASDRLEDHSPGAPLRLMGCPPYWRALITELHSRQPSAFVRTGIIGTLFHRWKARIVRRKRLLSLYKTATLVHREHVARDVVWRWKHALAAILMRRLLLKKRCFTAWIRACEQGAPHRKAVALADAYWRHRSLSKALEHMGRVTQEASLERARSRRAIAHHARRSRSQALRLWARVTSSRALDRQLGRIADGHFFFKLSRKVLKGWSAWRARRTQLRAMASRAIARRQRELFGEWRSNVEESIRLRAMSREADAYRRLSLLLRSMVCLKTNLQQGRLERRALAHWRRQRLDGALAHWQARAVRRSRLRSAATEVRSVHRHRMALTALWRWRMGLAVELATQDASRHLAVLRLRQATRRWTAHVQMRRRNTLARTFAKYSLLHRSLTRWAGFAAREAQLRDIEHRSQMSLRRRALSRWRTVVARSRQLRDAAWFLVQWHRALHARRALRSWHSKTAQARRLEVLGERARDAHKRHVKRRVLLALAHSLEAKSKLYDSVERFYHARLGRVAHRCFQAWQEFTYRVEMFALKVQSRRTRDAFERLVSGVRESQAEKQALLLAQAHWMRRSLIVALQRLGDYAARRTVARRAVQAVDAWRARRFLTSVLHAWKGIAQHRPRTRTLRTKGDALSLLRRAAVPVSAQSTPGATPQRRTSFRSVASRDSAGPRDRPLPVTVAEPFRLATASRARERKQKDQPTPSVEDKGVPHRLHRLTAHSKTETGSSLSDTAQARAREALASLPREGLDPSRLDPPVVTQPPTPPTLPPSPSPYAIAVDKISPWHLTQVPLDKATSRSGQLLARLPPDQADLVRRRVAETVAALDASDRSPDGLSTVIDESEMNSAVSSRQSTPVDSGKPTTIGGSSVAPPSFHSPRITSSTNTGSARAFLFGGDE
jgi:hypothetical protein